ncbi:MAG TPA: hypothetical protein VK816_03045, partial [Jatrophihabitantaceae bacterium]|nr:hypothetical protein [Jatrophihabitantaceae bacterium]
MADFPAALFELSGEPAAIRASAVPYREFADAAVRAAAQIRGLDTSLFVGPEADQYREGLSQELPPHLQQAGEAFGIVADALTGFAGDLDGLQERMSPLRVRAPHLWQDAQSEHSSDASAAQRAWRQCLDTATQINAELDAAVERCERQIREASGMRFHKNPSGLGAVASGVSNVVKDHAAGLAELSGALKTVSAITGMASFIPGIGEITLAISLVTGVAAMELDAATMSATGKWDLATLAVDGVVLLPAVGRVASKVFDVADAVQESRAAAVLEEPSTELNTIDKPGPPAKIGSEPLTSPTAEGNGGFLAGLRSRLPSGDQGSIRLGGLGDGGIEGATGSVGKLADQFGYT